MSMTEQGMAAKATDAALDDVLVNQLIWKNPSCAKVGVRILSRALAAGEFYPDEIDHADLPAADRNCVGSLFRFLASKRAGGIIRRTATFRRADREKAPAANGRTIFAYTLERRGLAAALVRRLGGRAEDPQQELTL